MDTKKSTLDGVPTAAVRECIGMGHGSSTRLTFIGTHGGRYNDTDVEPVERVSFYGGRERSDIAGSLSWR